MRQFLEDMGLSRALLWGVSYKGFWRKYETFAALQDAMQRLGECVEGHVQLKADPDTHLYSCALVDVDVNDALKHRPCCQDAKQTCAVCLSVIMKWACAVRRMVELIIEPQKVVVVYSGNKGFHLWIRTRHGMNLADRQALCKRVASVHTHDWAAYEVCRFLMDIPVEFLCALARGAFPHHPFPESVATLTQLLDWYAETVCSGVPRPSYLETVVKLFGCLFPLEYDRSVSTAPSHNGRLPWTVNRKTMRVARELCCDRLPVGHVCEAVSSWTDAV
jgi:hypothetical protein